ncbi:hypothetical protein HYDPIDRAFT_31651 [Hydnomerulius pinastri MD-312]|uniref:WD40 repeat-like protein n=1 Tax=Hydnomerulius pinastri MD-312 TaxID=994086 RepID=A0A0C9WBV6_9AGAM|nr:hypothetical protein HYDPIDRAFT_31651 [Hydnomerulius pinastri MD-312]
MTLNPIPERQPVPAIHARAKLSDHCRPVVKASFYNTGGLIQLLSASEHSAILAHDLNWSKTRVEPTPIAPDDGRVLTAFAISNAGLMASCGNSSLLRISNMAKQETIAISSVHPAPITHIDFSAGGDKMATASVDGTVIIWEDLPQMRDCSRIVMSLDTEIFCLKFSPEGNKLAVSTEADIHVYDPGNSSYSEHPVYTIQNAHKLAIMALAWCRDGRRLFSGSCDRKIRMWDVESKEAVGQPFCGHFDAVYSLSLSPNGRVLASASQDATVRLWDICADPHQEIISIKHSHAVRCVEFSPALDTSLIAATAHNIVMLWDASELELLKRPAAEDDDRSDDFLDQPAFPPATLNGVHRNFRKESQMGYASLVDLLAIRDEFEEFNSKASRKAPWSSAKRVRIIERGVKLTSPVRIAAARMFSVARKATPKQYSPISQVEDCAPGDSSRHTRNNLGGWRTILSALQRVWTRLHNHPQAGRNQAISTVD